jgi:hypothetical protein
MRRFHAALVMSLCAIALIAWATPAQAASFFHTLGVRPPGASVTTAAQSLAAGPPRPRMQWAVAAPLRGQATPPGNFPFQTTTGDNGKIIVHYYGRDAGFGQRAIATVESYVNTTIYTTLGLTLKRAVNIYIYADRNDFLVGAQPSDPNITSAYSDFFTGSIYLPLSGIPSDDADSILPHELTHIVFHQNEDTGMVQSQEVRFYPLWLDEGQAEHDVLPGTSFALYDQQTLQAAIATGTVYDLYKGFLFNYPQDPNVDNLGYAEAASFIGYLITTFGATTYHHFVAALPDGQIQVAAEEYFGADLQTLQNRWRVSIGTTALPHDSGPPLVAPTAEPFTHGTLGGLATQTTPYAVPGNDQSIGSAALIGLLLALGALLAIAAGWFQVAQGRRRLTTARAAEAQAASTASAMPNSAPYRPDAYGEAMMRSSPLADATTLPLPRVTSAKAQPLPRVRWLEMVPIALIAPAVLAVEFGWAPITGSFEWSQPFQVATWVAVGGGVVLLALAVLATVQRRLTAAYLGGVVVAIVLGIAAHGTAGTTGLAQGLVYEKQGAFALAVRVYTDAGAPGTTLGRVQEAWGQDAEDVHDNPAAILHLRAAVAVDPTSDYRAALMQEISLYGQVLTNAQEFSEAHAVYATQLASTTCDVACQGSVHTAAGQTDLAWAELLLVQGHQATALATVQGVVNDDAHTPAAASAQRVLAGQKNAISAAVSAGQSNDYVAMRLLLLLAKGTHNASGILPNEVPVDVTGMLSAISGSASGNRVFFAAFTSQSAAENFFNAQDDESVFKVATTLSSSGQYEVRLAPGYWYLVFWEDHTQKYDLNASSASDWSTFKVLPYISQDEGTIIGF